MISENFGLVGMLKLQLVYKIKMVNFCFSTLTFTLQKVQEWLIPFKNFHYNTLNTIYYDFYYLCK